MFTDVNFGIKTFLNAFLPGQAMIIWATGLGRVAGNEAAGPLPGDITVNIKVYVGGIEATLIAKGRSGCCAGADQIAFYIPNNAVISCNTPVYVVANSSIQRTLSLKRRWMPARDSISPAPADRRRLSG